MFDPSERLESTLPKLGENVYALIAGYPASCFARVTPAGLDLPPDLSSLKKGPFQLAWSLFQDIRAFGEKGEWHAWYEDGWHDRLLLFDGLKPEDMIDRLYPILGTRGSPGQGTWTLRTEDRGTSVWVPTEFACAGKPNKRPVLVVTQIVKIGPTRGADGETVGNGLLCGIGDAAIRQFTEAEAGQDE